MKKFVFLLALFSIYLLLSSFLTGCAGLGGPSPLPPSNQAVSWPQRSAALERLTTWQLAGSVSIQHQGKTDIATLSWQQQLNRYHIALYGPLSLGRVTIDGQPGNVTLVPPSQQAVSATNPEQLMQQQLGWHIPLSSLYYWVRGIPNPNAPANVKLDRYQHLQILDQQGWHIEYLAYTQVGQLDLPNTIVLSNTTLKVRLVIRKW